MVLTSQYILAGFEKLFVNNQKKKKSQLFLDDL